MLAMLNTVVNATKGKVNVTVVEIRLLAGVKKIMCKMACYQITKTRCTAKMAEEGYRKCETCGIAIKDLICFCCHRKTSNNRKNFHEKPRKKRI